MKVRKTILIDPKKWKQFRAKLLLQDKTVTSQIEKWIDKYLNDYKITENNITKKETAEELGDILDQGDKF